MDCTMSHAWPRVSVACICIAGDRARRSAKQQPSSAATARGQHCATARPENLCRARHVGHREEVLEDEVVHVRLDVDNPEARQHHGIGTAKTSVAAAKSC